MSKRIDSVPPIIRDLVQKLIVGEEWAKENACLQLENIANVCGAEARGFRKKQAQKKRDRQ